MTKLEQVARAIGEFDLDGASGIYEQQLMKAARAAVEALREPTEEMVKAAEQEIFEHMPGARDWTLLCAKDAIKAAIDAILSEKPDAD
jgi:hypothetical protein